MLSGPTSAKNPILLTFVILASITSPLNCGERAGTYGFEHNGLVPAAELGETRAGHDLALPDIQDRDDLDDIALEVSMRHVRICRSRSLPRHLGACDSLGQLWARTKLHHGRTKERRMQLDAVIEIFLDISAPPTYEEEHGRRAP